MPTNIYICIFLNSPCTFDLLTLWCFCVVQQQSPTVLAPGTGFTEDDFFRDWGSVEWFQDDSVYYIDCAFYFCFVAISEYSTLTLGLGFTLL